MNPPQRAKCDWCGVEFIPAAENFCEGGFEAFDASALNPSEKWKGEPQPLKDVTLSAEELKTLKTALEIDDQQAEELNRTGKLETAFVLCNACMNDEGCGDEHGGDRPWCNQCFGTGILDCLCGGDICVCENRGEIDCPYCD